MQFPLGCVSCKHPNNTCDHEMLSTTLFISLTSNLFQLEIRLSCTKFSVSVSSTVIWFGFLQMNPVICLTVYVLLRNPSSHWSNFTITYLLTTKLTAANRYFIFFFPSIDGYVAWLKDSLELTSAAAFNVILRSIFGLFFSPLH